MPRKTDALERLERWVTKRRSRLRWIGPVNGPNRGQYDVFLRWGPWKPKIGYGGVHGQGNTLAEAIHAALDQAEAKQ